MIEINNGIPNFHVVSGRMYRGGQPTDAGWRWLNEQAHVTRVIKLNEESEGSDDAARALGMEVIYLPINLSEQLVFRPRYEDVKAAVDAMQDYSIVHCTHGEDRTGLVVACHRVWKENWPKSLAEAEMKQRGFHAGLLGLELFWEWVVKG